MHYRKWLIYADKKGKEYETGGKIAPICPEIQDEEAASQYTKTCCNNEKKKSMILNENGKWFAPDKIKNKQKSVLQNKDAYDDVINIYLQKINYQRTKLLILREEYIEN